MPSDQGAPSPSDPRDLVRRAAAERAAEIFARMDEDDEQDSQDLASNPVLLSDDVSSRASSLGEHASSDDASGPLFDDSSDGDSDGTVQEEDFPTDTTVELPEEQLEAAVESVGSPAVEPEPSLSDPSPSVRSAHSSRSTLIATPRYRPTRRPPMAVLRVYDDDQVGYEQVRVRQSPFVIGRQDGDLVVGHERQMSRRHARIDRIEEGDVWRWYLGDLRSTNGTFLRVAQADVDDGTELLLAGELVRFSQPHGGEDALLTKVGPSSEEEQVRLSPGTHLVGSDPQKCLSFLRTSPYLDPHHLQIACGKKNQWRASDLGSTNHLWVGVTKRSELSDGSMFQIGEQRFSFHLP